jgi:hypothetical protein
LVEELRDKENTLAFFRSLQNISRGCGEECSIDNADELFHIVAFDSKLLRLAYFRYYVYNGKSKCGIIRTLGDDGLFFNCNPILEKKGGRSR